MTPPAAIAAVCSAAGVGFAVGGVYLLAGLGWASITASVPFLIVAFVLVRGMLR